MANQIFFGAAIAAQPLAQGNLDHLSRVGGQMVNLVKQFPINLNREFHLI